MDVQYTITTDPGKTNKVKHNKSKKANERMSVMPLLALIDR